jgi:uncharacterized protein (TIGR02246 family)
MTTTTSSTSAPAGAPSADAEMAAIAAMPARLVAAWDAYDADAFAQLFLEDGTMILPGLYKKGRADIRAYMADAYAGRYKGTRVTGKPVDVKPLAPGVVVLLTEGGVLAPGATELAAADTIWASWTLVKKDGAWQLAVYQNCQHDDAV